MSSVVNAWNLKHAPDGRWAEVYYNEDYTVFGLNPKVSPQPPAADINLNLWNLGNGTVAFQCGGGYNAYASARYGDYYGQVQFQAPGSADWIVAVQGDEIFKIIPTGDGYFAICSVTYNSYVTINPSANTKAQNCNALTTYGPVTDISQAARFTAVGLNRSPVLDFLQICQNASGMSLAGVNLANANCSGCNLSLCDFTQVASLNGCNLNSANLQKANFSKVSLAGASISGADFTGANLSYSDLSQVAAWQAPPILNGANLEGARLPASLANVQLAGAYLAGADLSNHDCSGANLSGANLVGTNLSGCNFTGANLSGAYAPQQDFRSVRLVNANLSGANLSGGNLERVNLTGTNLAGTNLSQMDLRTTQFPSPLNQSTDPNNPTSFAGSQLPYSTIGLNWSCLDLTGTTIVGLPASLANLNADSACLAGRSFQNAVLTGAQFGAATLTGAVFTGATLSQANFNGASMVGAVLTGARLDQCTFLGAALGGVTQNQAADLSFAYVANCDFSDSNLFGASFAGATLLGANKLSSSANLQETNFANAYLANVDFTGAVLRGAKFDGAFLVECVLTGADLSPTRSGSVAASLTSACLQGATFQGVNLAGADLSNAAVTAAAGSITQQYYDQYGNLTPPTPINYPAQPLPAASSLSAQTVCPNGATYATNQSNGLSPAQMMTGANAPTSWKPVGSPAKAMGAAK